MTDEQITARLAAEGLRLAPAEIAPLAALVADIEAAAAFVQQNLTPADEPAGTFHLP